MFDRVACCVQPFDFMGGSEIAFMHEGKRSILTVTYKGEGGGSILFHQTSWDPVFLQDIDPEAAIDLDAQLHDHVSNPYRSIVLQKCTT